MNAIVTDTPYQIGGNVLNNGLIDNLPKEAVVEVPCLVDGSGVQGTHVGALPVQCAALNMTNINVQLLTIEAALTQKRSNLSGGHAGSPHQRRTADRHDREVVWTISSRRMATCCRSTADFRSSPGRRRRPLPGAFPSRAGNGVKDDRGRHQNTGRDASQPHPATDPGVEIAQPERSSSIPMPIEISPRLA